MPPRRKTYGTTSKSTQKTDCQDRTPPTLSSTSNSRHRRTALPADVATDVFDNPMCPWQKKQQRNITVLASNVDHSRTPKGSTSADRETGHPLKNQNMPTIVKAVLYSLSGHTKSSDTNKLGSTSGSQADISFIPSKLQLASLVNQTTLK